MSSLHSLDANTRVVRLTFSGPVTLAEWEATLQAVFDEPDYKPNFRFLVDWRLALPPEVHFIRSAVAFLRANRHQVSGTRWAMVVAEQRMLGLMRLANELSRDLVKGTWVFHSSKEAEQWLLSS